jgi:hypothetical protein
VATSTQFALFIIFIEHQFKRVLKQNFVLFLLDYDHALHIQQLKGEKYEHPSSNWALGPTSTPGPRRDQLVLFSSLKAEKQQKEHKKWILKNLISFRHCLKDRRFFCRCR